MIEDNSIGLKVTENEDETIWTMQKTALENEIKNLEKLLKVNKVYLEKTNEMLKQFSVKDASLSEPKQP